MSLSGRAAVIQIRGAEAHMMVASFARIEGSSSAHKIRQMSTRDKVPATIESAPSAAASGPTSGCAGSPSKRQSQTAVLAKAM